MMPSLGPDSDSEDELPPAWEERTTNDGFVYYVNHQNKATQWSHPRTGKTKRVKGELPLGWERQIEEDTNKIIYIDTKTGQRTYTDPRLAFAIEELPKNVGEVRQRFDACSTAFQILHGKDLNGKIAVITGANSGIGFETAKSLAFHGCEVIFACRNQKATENAIQQIWNEKLNAGKKCSFMELDLASLKSVKNFVKELKQRITHIDMLILNASVFGIPHTLTEDNLETTFQVSHLSHFYLTNSVENLLNLNSRVIVVSSESHRQSMLSENLTEQMLSLPYQKYWSMIAYNNAKLCNTLFARELAKRWLDKGICVYSLHPGNMVTTGLAKNWWFYRLIFALVRPFTKSLQQAASTTVYCATASELTGISGYYFNNCFFCEPSRSAQNDNLAKELWNISEEMLERILSNG